MNRRLPIAAALAALALAQSPKKQPYTEWRDYGGSPDSAQYSALKQINKANVARLELAWFHATPGPSAAPNPVVIDGMMYTLGANRSIVAIEAATGKLKWSHPVEGGAPAERGLNYWESKDRSDRRLIYTAGSYLQEINALTGVTINTFGNDGRVDLRENLGRDPRTIRGIQSKNPGRVFENLVIIGSVTGEGFGSPPGDVRAYDVVTGKLVWTFHTIPRPGEFGYDTWPPDAYKYAGGANVWGEIAVDEKRAIVFLPTGSPTADLYGADRKGANLFGNCLIALDARSGRRLWHFQTVHHDLWDYDLTTGPKLITVKHNGRTVDAVAQAGKTGFLYVFNRATGEPLWPIEERPVPKSEVPGEESWPTQPVPTKPPAFSRQKLSVDELNPYIDAAEREKLKDTLLKAANEGVFTPSSHLRNHIQIPGAFGGSNWGAVAGDPTSGMIYVRAYDAPSIRQLTERVASAVRVPANATPEQRGYAAYMRTCSGCHGENRRNMAPFKLLGMDVFKTIVRNGRAAMPAFTEEDISTANLELVAAYLANPEAGVIAPAGGRGAQPPDAPRGPSRPEGIREFNGPFGAQWLTASGLPAIGPPWSELVAYDLNQGVIKWRVPAGNNAALAEKGITGTGSYRPRNGPVVTAGGVIFLAGGSERAIRAYDKDNGKVLWEQMIEANPDGIPAVYEVGGQQYVVFYAAGDPGGGSRSLMNHKAGKPEAQGYYAYALKRER